MLVSLWDRAGNLGPARYSTWTKQPLTKRAIPVLSSSPSASAPRRAVSYHLPLHLPEAARRGRGSARHHPAEQALHCTGAGTLPWGFSEASLHQPCSHIPSLHRSRAGRIAHSNPTQTHFPKDALSPQPRPSPRKHRPCIKLPIPISFRSNKKKRKEERLAGRRELRGAYMLLAVALQEQEVRGVVEGIPHAAPAPLLGAAQRGAVPPELLVPGAAQAALAEAAPQGRGGAEPLSARQHPHGPPRPVPLQLPRLGVDACGGRDALRSAPMLDRQHPETRRGGEWEAASERTPIPRGDVPQERGVLCPFDSKKRDPQPVPSPLPHVPTDRGATGELRIHSIPCAAGGKQGWRENKLNFFRGGGGRKKKKNHGKIRAWMLPAGGERR